MRKVWGVRPVMRLKYFTKWDASTKSRLKAISETVLLVYNNKRFASLMIKPANTSAAD
jgi:hypothetical protein